MSHSYKIYIIAGEASGDLHGAEIVKSLNTLNEQIQFRGWGGDRLVAAGVQIDIRYEKTNFMGFSEVVKNLGKILGFFRLTKRAILDWKPDALILIDYPGFNLRMAKWAFNRNIPVYYYIAPQVWAWKEGRTKLLKKYLRKLFVVLPFELNYFQKHQLEVQYFGHPLAETISKFKFNPDFRSINQLSSQSILALLPGSRAQEIATMLPVFLESVKNETNFQIVVAGLTQHKKLYQSLTLNYNGAIHVVYDDTYNLLYQSHHALVTSGTATLETALFGVPLIVCYKGNQLSYYLARKLIKVKFISLVNLIADRSIVPELIQHECNPIDIKRQLNYLKDPAVRAAMKLELSQLFNLLKGEKCYENVASTILNDLECLKNELVK